MSWVNVRSKRLRQRRERRRQQWQRLWRMAIEAETQRTGLPARDIPVWIDGDGRLRIGGEPRCPVDGEPCECQNQMGCEGSEVAA